MNIRRTRLKVSVLLLISGGALACTCASLNVDFRQVVTDVLQVVGVSSRHHSGQQPQEIIVSAGNELTIDGKLQRLTPLGPDEVVKRLAWAGMYERDGWLSFRGQSLDIVVAEFNRHNRRQLRVGDPRTGSIQVGGKFKVNDLDAFVAALGKTNGVRATLSGERERFGDVIILSGGDSSGSAEIEGAPERDPALR